MINRLTKAAAYLIIVVSLFFVFATLVSMFNAWDWWKTRMVALVIILIMLVLLKQMHEYRRSRLQFYCWTVFVIIFAFVEISAIISLLFLTITDSIELDFTNSGLNTIMLIFGLLFNMIAGAWTVDRITEVGR